MNGAQFDLVALGRAFVLSLGAGLIGRAIAVPLAERRAWKQGVTLATIGVVLVLTVVVFTWWPWLATIPRLDGLSRAEAEVLLTKAGLTADPRPQYASGVEAGRVVPDSQNPKPGLKVRPKEVVSFGVAEPPPEVSLRQGSATAPPRRATVSLFEPRPGGSVRGRRTADGLHRISVRGTSTGTTNGDLVLLLWVRPVNPPADAPGWYLQRPPANGIRQVETDGSWEGLAQIGNAQWPPHEGDLIDVAVSVAERAAADRMMAEADVVRRDQPVGIDLVRASGVVVTLR